MDIQFACYVCAFNMVYVTHLERDIRFARAGEIHWLQMIDPILRNHKLNTSFRRTSLLPSVHKCLYKTRTIIIIKPQPVKNPHSTHD